MDDIRWIFFDIGSTLADEEEAYRHRIRDMIRGSSVTFEQFWEKRVAYAKAGYNGDQAAIAYFGLSKTPWHSEDETPFPDAAPVLEALKRRGFRLGVIANQAPGSRERLAKWDLLQYFDVIVASAEAGVDKPDPAIFRMALEQASCRPENAIMVGDRLDNDIRPAKALGMTTVRMKKGLAIYMKPACEAEVPDYTVDSLSEMQSILCTIEQSESKVMFAPAAQVMPCLRHSDVAPFGRSDVMCSAHVPQHTSRPKGTSLAKQTSRSATRNTSFKETFFVR